MKFAVTPLVLTPFVPFRILLLIMSMTNITIMICSISAVYYYFPISVVVEAVVVEVVVDVEVVVVEVVDVGEQNL